jgi:vancomycin resistance protein VanW
MISKLPRGLKRQIRIIGCRLVAAWRRYPRNARKLLLNQEETDQLASPFLNWETSITPIPRRGTIEIQKNRVHNLERAISLINNRLILPGQAFSLSQNLGEPTIENGFQSGPVFAGGKVLADAGGGLCLIATNLYSLFLKSGCQILERHNHSIDAYGNERFYELGQDAAIAYAYKDLAIRNNFKTPLLLEIGMIGDTVQSRLSAALQKPVEVIVRSHVLQRIPPAIQDQHPGWHICTTRYARKENACWRQDYVSFSHYMPC